MPKTTDKSKIKKVKVVKKSSKAKKSTFASNNARRLKLPQYKSFKMHKKIRPHQPKLSSGYKLIKVSINLVRNNKKLFIGIVITNILLSLILVNSSKNSLNIGDLKSSLGEVYSGKTGSIFSLVTLLGVLFSSTGSTQQAINNGASVYQTLIIFVTTLSVIWALRQVIAKQKITIRDAFYKSMGPLIPFILVLMAIAVQLLPLSIGAWLYAQVIGGGIAVYLVEKVVWIILILALAVLSFYLLISSIFAPFIVTLPNMAPFKALKSARQLVRHRRLIVLRKILFLPLALFILIAVIMLPFLIYLPVIAEFVYFTVSSFSWVLGIIYLYSLYRELLNE